MELERKVVSLESEVKVVKGEVKQLLIDLREIMNNEENPFYRVQALPDQKIENFLPEKRSKKTADLNETIEEKENIKSTKNNNSAYNSGKSDPENGFPPSSANNTQNNMPDQPGYGANAGLGNAMQTQYDGNGEGFSGFNGFPDQAQDNIHNPFPENSEEALWAHRRMQARNSLNNADNPEREKTKGSEYPGFGFDAENPSGFSLEDLNSLKQHENLVREGYEVGDEKISALKRSASGRKTDIFMLIELMRWTDHTLKTIEKEKLKETLDLYELAGYLPEYVKTLVLKIINISYQDTKQEYRAGMKDYIRAISQLNTVLNPGKIDSRLMHFVFEGMPWREAENEPISPYNPEGSK